MKTITASGASQIIILLAIVVGWGVSLGAFYLGHTAAAQPIADGGWAALLALLRADLALEGNVKPPVP